MHLACMILTRNRSSVVQHFESGNAIEIRNGIMFDFYSGLPHIQNKVNIWLTFNKRESVILDTMHMV